MRLQLMLIGVLLGLVALATAQDNDTTTDEPATEEDMMMNGMNLTADDELVARYGGSVASEFRRRHFYCLDMGKVSRNFPDATTSSGNVNNVRPLYWAIFLQYPVLSYLDSRRKESLFQSIAAFVRNGDNSDLANFGYTDFCIGNVTHYRVSQYDESVLINVFFNNQSSVINQNNEGSSITTEAFNNAFLTGYRRAVRDEGPNVNLVATFEGRDAIVVNPELPTDNLTQTELNKHPGVVAFENSRDPTLRAIFLASFDRYTTIEDALNTPNLPFAENPDPTNFGLEAGDIVFAVFGSLFLLVVGGLTVLGFCIHPFFLA